MQIRRAISRGFMMIEVLVAASIIAVTVLSAMTLAQKSVRVARQSLHATQAAFLLEEGAEAVRLLRDNDWAGIAALASGTEYYPDFSGSAWALSETPGTIGIFTRTVSVAEAERDAAGNITVAGTPDPDTRLFTITVSWLEGGTVVEKTLQFYLMNIFS